MSRYILTEDGYVINAESGDRLIWEGDRPAVGRNWGQWLNRPWWPANYWPDSYPWWPRVRLEFKAVSDRNFARVLIADRTGRIIAEIEPQVGPVSWRLNDTGKATFEIARTDPKATEDYLQFGNRVLIQFGNGLPDWGGMIDPPRKWTRDGKIVVTAYSGEYLLGLRQTDRGRYFSGSTVGTIYRSLIEEANAARQTGLSIGTVWTGGDGHSPAYHFDNLLEITQESLTRRLSSNDFGVISREQGGYIVMDAYFWERRGADRPGVVLLEGQNISSVELLEQGPIINSWDIVGKGDGWADNRPMAHAEDAGSISAYGLREGSEIHADTSVQATIDRIAASRLAETSQPRHVINPDVVSLPPAEFGAYHIGDSLRCILYSYGFGGYDGMIRVLTREYNWSTGACSLVVAEV